MEDLERWQEAGMTRDAERTLTIWTHAPTADSASSIVAHEVMRQEQEAAATKRDKHWRNIHGTAAGG